MYNMKHRETLEPAAFADKLTPEEKQRRIDNILNDLKLALEEDRDFVVMIMTPDGGVRVSGGSSFVNHGMMLEALAAQHNDTAINIKAMMERDRKNEHQ